MQPQRKWPEIPSVEAPLPTSMPLKMRLTGKKTGGINAEFLERHPIWMKLK